MACAQLRGRSCHRGNLRCQLCTQYGGGMRAIDVGLLHRTHGMVDCCSKYGALDAESTVEGSSATGTCSRSLSLMSDADVAQESSDCGSAKIVQDLRVLELPLQQSWHISQTSRWTEWMLQTPRTPHTPTVEHGCSSFDYIRTPTAQQDGIRFLEGDSSPAMAFDVHPLGIDPTDTQGELDFPPEASLDASEKLGCKRQSAKLLRENSNASADNETCFPSEASLDTSEMLGDGIFLPRGCGRDLQASFKSSFVLQVPRPKAMVSRTARIE